ncbi:MAG: glycosyltransferase family 2 protein, partial [Alistipes sp.]|nr:glycosyltransferase family 2 protein [Alistipes sp.]
PQNGGAGVARQYGIDHSDNEFIIFADSDDCLASAFACELLSCSEQ